MVFLKSFRSIKSFVRSELVHLPRGFLGVDGGSSVRTRVIVQHRGGLGALIIEAIHHGVSSTAVLVLGPSNDAIVSVDR